MAAKAAATKNHTYTNVADQNQLTAENAEFYSRTLLERLKPELALAKYAEKSSSTNIPKKSGDTISWRRFNAVTVGNHKLVEGVTPNGIDASVTKINSTVSQYGAYLQTTDYLDTVGLDPVITEFSEVMGEHAGQTVETIIRDVVTAGTNVIYAGGASDTTGAAANKITADDILKIRRQMKRNKVKPITLPSGGVGYIMFAHTDVITDLMKTKEWKDANTYVDHQNLLNGIAGRLYGIYFMEYDFIEKDANTYKNFVIGKGAYGIPDVAGSAKPKMIVKPVGSAGTADPLDQRSTVGWKALLTAVRLQELAIVRYESGATA